MQETDMIVKDRFGMAEILCSLTGWAIFLAVLIGNAMQYGKRWEFGPHGFTRVLVAGDGKHYRDGTAIDPITLALHNSGQEEAFQLAAIGIIAATGRHYFVYTVLRMQRQLPRTATDPHEKLGREPPESHDPPRT